MVRVRLLALMTEKVREMRGAVRRIYESTNETSPVKNTSSRKRAALFVNSFFVAFLFFFALFFLQGSYRDCVKWTRFKTMISSTGMNQTYYAVR